MRFFPRSTSLAVRSQRTKQSETPIVATKQGYPESIGSTLSEKDQFEIIVHSPKSSWSLFEDDGSSISSLTSDGRRYRYYRQHDSRKPTQWCCSSCHTDTTLATSEDKNTTETDLKEAERSKAQQLYTQDVQKGQIEGPTFWSWCAGSPSPKTSADEAKPSEPMKEPQRIRIDRRVPMGCLFDDLSEVEDDRHPNGKRLRRTWLRRTRLWTKRKPVHAPNNDSMIAAATSSQENCPASPQSHEAVVPVNELQRV